MLHIYPLFAINKRKYGFKAIKIDEFRQQTDMLIVVTIESFVFYSPEKIQIMAKNSPDEGKTYKNGGKAGR